MTLLALDARWRRLMDPDYACPCCGRSFGGLVDIGFDQPDAWSHGPRDPGHDVLEVGEDKLSADLCRAGARRFLRAVLPLPVRGAEDAAILAPWVEVAPADFYATLEAIEAGEAPPPCPGTLANELPGHGAPAGTLAAGSAAERPVFEPADGPLAAAATDGIGFDALLDLYAALGEDLRPHLKG